MAALLNGITIFLLIVALTIGQAELVEDASQCALPVEEEILPESKNLVQTVYTPTVELIDPWIIVCMGSSSFPSVQEFDTIDGFQVEDCGNFPFQTCCNVNTLSSVDEVPCDGASKFAICGTGSSPERQHQVTCPPPGSILAMLTFPGIYHDGVGVELVLVDNDDGTLYFAGNETTVVTQPDGTYRFSPDPVSQWTKIFVARPYDLQQYRDTCMGNFSIDLPSTIHWCLGGDDDSDEPALLPNMTLGPSIVSSMIATEDPTGGASLMEETEEEEEEEEEEEGRCMGEPPSELEALCALIEIEDDEKCVDYSFCEAQWGLCVAVSCDRFEDFGSCTVGYPLDRHPPPSYCMWVPAATTAVPTSSSATTTVVATRVPGEAKAFAPEDAANTNNVASAAESNDRETVAPALVRDDPFSHNSGATTTVTTILIIGVLVFSVSFVWL
jgi:hypothetical protein